MNDFFTWQALASSAGATLATGLVTQLLKEAGLLKKVPTRLLSLGIAQCILLAATLFTGPVTLSSLLLTLPNAVVTALAAQGGYEMLHGISTSGSGSGGTGSGG